MADRPHLSPPRFLLLLLALAEALPLAGALGGVLWAAEPPAPAAPPTPAEAPVSPPTTDLPGRASDHVPGEIHMTAFIDFYCSHCHHFDTVVVPVLEKEYGDKLKIHYVGLPIVDPRASQVPLLAYYLAEDQGKGDAMRELLFSAIWEHKVDVTQPGNLLAVAQQAGLDLEKFKAGFNAHVVEYGDILWAWSQALRQHRPDALAEARAKVTSDMGERMFQGIETAADIGAHGTPTVLLDNHIRLNDNSLRAIEGVFADLLK